MKEILHSRIVGEGKPLLILHGYFGMGDNWKSHANKFAADGFQVHLIDQRNHGRSFHSDEFNYELLVEDLYDYINYHDLEKVNLIGHSMGGKTVMLFSTEHPELIEKMIVADISPREYPPHHHDIINALQSIDFSIHNSRKLVDAKLAERIPEVGIRQFLLKNTYWREKGVMDFRFNLTSLTENNIEVGQPLPSFTIFEGETLFLRGSKSGYIAKEDEPLISAHFPNSKIETIPNAGHWLHAENPTDFYKEAIGFIKN